MKTLVEMTQPERAALTQQQLDAVMAAKLPGYPDSGDYHAKPADLKRHEPLFGKPLPAGLRSHEAWLNLTLGREAGMESL